MKKPHLTFHRHAAFLGELFLLLWHLLNSVIQEREEALLKQQNTSGGDLDLSPLTLEEPSSSVEEVVTTISSPKVSGAASAGGGTCHSRPAF